VPPTYLASPEICTLKPLCLEGEENGKEKEHRDSLKVSTFLQEKDKKRH
jgi:hypothetical protein